jgi:hypothetical protein
MFQVISPAKYIPNCPAGKQCLFGVCFAAIAPEALSKWIPVVIPRELVSERNIFVLILKFDQQQMSIICCIFVTIKL